jgi:hypothetical protein
MILQNYKNNAILRFQAASQQEDAIYLPMIISHHSLPNFSICEHPEFEAKFFSLKGMNLTFFQQTFPYICERLEISTVKH